MFGEDVGILVAMIQPPVQFSGGVEFLFEPERQSLEEKSEAVGRVGYIRLEQSVELEERLVVKSHIIQVLRLDSSFTQTVVQSMFWEAMIMFLPGETLFLRSGNELPVADQTGRAVMIEGGDAQDFHFPIPFLICQLREPSFPGWEAAEPAPAHPLASSAWTS